MPDTHHDFETREGGGFGKTPEIAAAVVGQDAHPADAAGLDGRVVTLAAHVVALELAAAQGVGDAVEADVDVDVDTGAARAGAGTGAAGEILRGGRCDGCRAAVDAGGVGAGAAVGEEEEEEVDGCMLVGRKEPTGLGMLHLESLKEVSLQAPLRGFGENRERMGKAGDQGIVPGLPCEIADVVAGVVVGVAADVDGSAAADEIDSAAAAEVAAARFAGDRQRGSLNATQCGCYHHARGRFAHVAKSSESAALEGVRVRDFG